MNDTKTVYEMTDQELQIKHHELTTAAEFELTKKDRWLLDSVNSAKWMIECELKRRNDRIKR